MQLVRQVAYLNSEMGILDRLIANDTYRSEDVMVKDVLIGYAISGLYQNEKPTHDIYRLTTCNIWEIHPESSIVQAPR